MFIKHILAFYPNIIRWDFGAFECPISINNENNSFSFYSV